MTLRIFLVSIPDIDLIKVTFKMYSNFEDRIIRKIIDTLVICSGI